MRVALFLVLSIVTPTERTVVDGAGREVSVPIAPRRIISMAPSVTEILFAVGSGERVVGVTDFCDHPPEAGRRSRIGGMINPDLERLVSLRPDLVIASTSGNYADDTERVERLGIPVYAIHTPSVEAILQTIVIVADLTGEKRRGIEVASVLRERIEAIRAGSATSDDHRPRTLLVIEPEPLIATGRDTFIGEALEIAGAEVAQIGTEGSASRWAQYDMEQVIRMRPDVILTMKSHEEWSRRILDDPDWRRIPAVAAGRVHVISDAIQHPGPRLVDGIEEVARILSEIRGDAGGVRIGGEEMLH